MFSKRESYSNCIRPGGADQKNGKRWEAMAGDLVTLTKTFTAAEAHLLRGVLENHGLEAVVTDEHTSSLTVYGTGARVLVLEEDYEEAMLVIKSQEVEEAMGAEVEEPTLLDEIPLHESDEEDEQDQELVGSPKADSVLDRAFVSAALGLLFVPLQVYSVWLLGELWQMDERVSEKKRWKVYVTPFMNLWLVAALVLFLSMFTFA